MSEEKKKPKPKKEKPEPKKKEDGFLSIFNIQFNEKLAG